MELLVVSTRLELGPSEVVRHVVRVADAACAKVELAARSFDGLIIDCGAGCDVESALDGLHTPGLALLLVIEQPGPQALPDATAAGALVVEFAWVADDHEALVRYLLAHSPDVVHRRELRRLRERQAQLVHSEKFAAVGLLAAEVAHEINNPATFVITNLTVMIDYIATIAQFHAELRDALAVLGHVDPQVFGALETAHEIRFLEEDLDALLERSLTGLNRIHQIVQDLKYFGSDHRRESDWVDLDSLVHAALNLVRHEARFRAQLEVKLPRLPPIRSDANRLSQVILNVLVNAVQSIDAGDPDNNRVTVEATVSDDHIVLSITDTGSGIAPESIDEIFEPFYTTKDVGEGTGLGLAISRDIMRTLGGEIRADSELGEGSRFEIVIPRASGDDD